jgi:hypothetical protein
LSPRPIFLLQPAVGKNIQLEWEYCTESGYLGDTMRLSESKQKILDEIVVDLKQVSNIEAIVLGGSHCLGMANDGSDLDIGLYYHQNSPFDINEIEHIARKYHIDEMLTITGFYQWGAWVNGGAWMNTTAGEVDFLYRNIEQVRDTIKKSKEGIWENDYEQQPPYGFSSVIYLGETYYCNPLSDPHNVVQELKRELEYYPAKLKNAILQQALWSAEFSIWQSKKFIKKEDMYNALGCFTRALKYILEALFALNEMYYIGDNNAVQRIAGAPKCPDNLKGKIEDILTVTNNTLHIKEENLQRLFKQVRSLAGDMYNPYYEL